MLRIESVRDAVEILLQLWKPSDGIAASPLIELMHKAVQRCEQAAAAIESSGIEPQIAVPAVAGAKDDIIALKVFRDCIKVFSDSGSAEFRAAWADRIVHIRDGKLLTDEQEHELLASGTDARGHA